MKIFFILTVCSLLVVFQTQAQFIPAGSGSGGDIPPDGVTVPGVVGQIGTPIMVLMVMAARDYQISKMASENRKKINPEMKEDFKNMIEVINFIAMENAANFVLTPDAQIEGLCTQEDKSQLRKKSKVLDSEILEHLKALVKFSEFSQYLMVQYGLSDEESKKLIETINKMITDFE